MIVDLSTHNVTELSIFFSENAVELFNVEYYDVLFLANYKNNHLPIPL